MKFNPDLVVFQIGENINISEISQEADSFQLAYIKLVESIDAKRKIVCFSFWPNKDKDKNRIITEVALKTASSILDRSHLGSGLESLNLAQSENMYSHSGVASHPGNYGMENIAKTIFSVARTVAR